MALAIVAACQSQYMDLPALPSQVVIEGVLSPTALTQVILVERTLTGESAAPPTQIPGDASDPVEPIVTNGGVPEHLASVELTLPNGQVLTTHERSLDSATDYRGAGVYEFKLAGSALVPGGTYQVRVVTAEQEIVTAETTVPLLPPVTTGVTTTFNRTSDTLALSWPTTPAAPAYQVRIESPFGAWVGFTDRAGVALSGDLRNPTNADISHVFIPGFQQLVSVSAVDANLYDYYRSSNNSFVGSGIINHVNGGLGVFGSIVPIQRQTLNVTASPTRPIEGRFDLVPDAFGLGYSYGPSSMTLYVESPAVKKNQDDAITASVATNVAGFQSNAIGTYNGTQLKLYYVSSTLADTLNTFFGTLHGDTLTGQFSLGAPAKYVKH
jgi:hypothetical protein